MSDHEPPVLEFVGLLVAVVVGFVAGLTEILVLGEVLGIWDVL